jgi:hypothetical protein
MEMGSSKNDEAKFKYCTSLIGNARGSIKYCIKNGQPQRGCKKKWMKNWGKLIKNILLHFLFVFLGIVVAKKFVNPGQ